MREYEPMKWILCENKIVLLFSFNATLSVYK